jgi:hypothetical protein
MLLLNFLKIKEISKVEENIFPLVILLYEINGNTQEL